MEARVIRTETQYEAYLSEVESLLSRGPNLNMESSERLDLLTVLIESYENQKYPIEPPDPIEAIKFRMAEKGLKQADLVPYFGTRSRVSEVLSGKRSLSISMIRALSVGLGISAETLIGVMDEPNSERKKRDVVDWSRFPAKEMIARGWIEHASGRDQSSIKNKVQQFISQIGWEFGDAAFKRSIYGDAYSPSTKYALHAWLSRVVQKSREQRNGLPSYNESILSEQLLREIAQLSWLENGPALAIEYLEKLGISVVVEPHLKGTMLDGAALRDTDGTPIIGLTLRHDRLDNFWFTVIHEIVHIWKHVGANSTFMDDLDSTSNTDRREAEANRIAKDALIPRLAWRRSDASRHPSEAAIEQLSRELRINPAIIAGRIRKETGDYRAYSHLIGNGEVRKLLLD